MSDRVFILLERHQKIDAAIASLRRGRWVDPFELARLKKLKLAIKDRIARAVHRPAARHA